MKTPHFRSLIPWAIYSPNRQTGKIPQYWWHLIWVLSTQTSALMPVIHLWKAREQQQQRENHLATFRNATAPALTRRGMNSVLYFTQIGESTCSLPNHTTPTPYTEFSPINWGNTRIAHWAFMVIAFISSDVFPVAGLFVWRSTQESQHFETPVLYSWEGWGRGTNMSCSCALSRKYLLWKTQKGKFSVPP